MQTPVDRATRRPAPDEVFNQVPPLVDEDFFASDRTLRDAVLREGAASGTDELHRVGRALADPANVELARQANQSPPVWKSFDPQGHRVDRIDFHPAWHRLMEGIVARGFHASPWEQTAPSRAHTIRAAGYLMQARVEQGTLCPTTMTYGAVAALRRDDWAALAWVPRILSRVYDPRDLPVEQKHGALIGMGMTEKQGGSDVRANTTRAVRSDVDGYRLTGHKWFYSAPQCDAHLVLAYATDASGADEGLTCFLVPRFEPDGTRNAVRVQRLKDKLGNRSNASSEVEFACAWGRRLGEPGRGVPTILEMGTYTRLDCVIGTAGMMREAVVQAIHHARHRATFGVALVDQPLMTAVLADLAIESAAATALALRLARAFDAHDDEDETLFRRLMTSASKFWVCKRGPELAAEAMEVLGGNGYVEEGPMARLYREMPVNSIWEGSGNIMCLDVLRALGRSQRTAELILAELERARGRTAAFDRAVDRFATLLSTQAFDEGSGRGLVRQLVTLTQASLLLRSDTCATADAFCATRLSTGTAWGAVYGELPRTCDVHAIVDRSWAG
ncbi:MAG: isovaleryl-CoA dehydrogenase [Burkholderiaceae bacterium]